MDHAGVLRIVERHWDREVEKGCGYTVPALGLTRASIEAYAAGEGEELPGVEDLMEPRHLLAQVEGKDVLCLASGGGQQSAVFGLLGARITAFDLCEGQLRADRIAAEHYGYEVRTLKGDACNLPASLDASFDLVYQAPGVGWIPDIRAVYRGVHRVLRPGGLYRVALHNPAVLLATWEDGVYRILDRYKGGPVLLNTAGVENMEEGEPTGDHRHLFRDSVGGLLDAGFVLRYFAEDPHDLREPVGEPNTWSHARAFLGLELNAVAQKPPSQEGP